MNWKTISSEYLFKDMWFTVRKDVCEKPDGKIVSPYYVYEFPSWVSAVALTEDNKVVMVRQYRHAIAETIIEIPGGCVDDTDASYEVAVARELKEETGYEFAKYDYLGKISANPSTNNNWMHMFLATGGKKIAEQQLDPNEEIEVVLLSIDELKQLLNDHQIFQAMHVTTIMYALRQLGEANW
jgi:ADP-ribose pyrophosphatase